MCQEPLLLLGPTLNKVPALLGGADTQQVSETAAAGGKSPDNQMISCLFQFLNKYNSVAF